MQTAMRAISIVLGVLVGLQPIWSQQQEQDGNTPAPVRGTTPPGRGATPERGTISNQGTTSGQGTTTGRTNVPAPRAPDGDTYKRPVSIAQTPKVHPRETNTGRLPAGPRGGESSGAIIGVAAAAGGVIALGSWMHARNKPEAQLSRNGPKMPDQFNMSGFSIAAFVQAGWPLVVDHVLAIGGELSISVQVEGLPPFNYRIRGTGLRQQEIFRLPAYFPARPTPGMYTMSATTGRPGVAAPVYMRLFGMGAGERAVGSVAIDQVRFGPDTIRPKQKQQALYAFHSHTDFDRVRAEFMKAVTAQGQIVSKLEDHDDINGVQRETTPSRQWNGRKASVGEHLLQVRAWESALAKSNWVIAWSADQVLVEE